MPADKREKRECRRGWFPLPPKKNKNKNLGNQAMQCEVKQMTALKGAQQNLPEYIHVGYMYNFVF